MKQKKEVRPKGRTKQQTARFVALNILPETNDLREFARGMVLVAVMFLVSFVSACIDAGVFV